MNKDKSKIITDTINYLKYYKDHNNYNIYESDIISSDSTLSIFRETESSGTDYELINRNEIQSSNNFSDKKNLALKESKIILQVKESVKENKISVANANWMKSDTLDNFAIEISDCRKCKVLASGRKQIVFGSGNPNADVVVVGEAPGADEDEQGKPFVGRAGKLLTDILKAINFTREEIFICNILKCRPPDNRNPLPDEIENCEPYLFKQLEMIKPKLILAVGTFASQTLLRSKEPLGKLRGRFHVYKGIKMMVTYHPAALLRNPNWKKPTWEDVQLFRKEYDRLVKS